MTGNLTVGECYENPIKYAKAFLRVRELFGFDSGPLFGHPATGAAEFGGRLSYPRPSSRTQAPIITKHPVNKPEDVDRLQVMDPSHTGEIPKYVTGAKYVLENYPKGFQNPTINLGDPFTWAGNVMGVETMLMWMEKEPDLVFKVLGKCVEFEVEAVRYALSQLGDSVMFMEGAISTSNDLLTPKQFEVFVLPPLKKYRENAMKAGATKFMAHPCGDQRLNIDFWAQVPGTYAINFDFRTPLETIISKLSNMMMIVGNIECMHFSLGDYDMLYNNAWEKLTMAATSCKHGYIVAPGCEIPVTSSPVNIHAMVQAARDYAGTKDWKSRKPK
jgi:uroporphyrinogen decarboxylase